MTFSPSRGLDRIPTWLFTVNVFYSKTTAEHVCSSARCDLYCSWACVQCAYPSPGDVSIMTAIIPLRLEAVPTVYCLGGEEPA